MGYNVNHYVKVGDIIRVSEGIFPEYPFSFFVVTEFIDSDIGQICIKPLRKNKEIDSFVTGLWINFDPTIHTVIKDKDTIDFLWLLYA